MNLTGYKCVIAFVLLFVFASSHAAEDVPTYFDTNSALEERVDDLISRLTLDEKVGLLWERAAPIERLSVPKYDYGNEALHGVVRPGKFTVFPQAIGLAATWNPALIERVATAISDEARGRWNELGHGAQQNTEFSDLLTFFSPTINMARDPRWGRTAETYGEDPFLTSRIGVAFVQGLQGHHPIYIKAAATPKHYVANNVEKDRFSANSIISERALREYYLPAFRAAIVDGKAQSIMSAYNAVNYVPSTANRWLLTDLLRDEWGFDGYVVSDCGAAEGIQYAHKYVATQIDGAAVAIKAGLDLDCNGAGGSGRFMREYLPLAYKQGKVTLAEIDNAVRRVLRVRFRLGLFDPIERNPYNQISPEVVGSPAHQTLSLETARESMVLIKNVNDTLPLIFNSHQERQKIAVVGHLANKAVFGDYSGQPVNESVTPLQGLTEHVGNRAEILHIQRVLKVHDFTIIPPEYLSTTDGQPGLLGHYFNNTLLKGPGRQRLDAPLDLHSTENAPDPYLRNGGQSGRWTGNVTVPSGNSTYRIGVMSDDGVRVWIDDELLIDEWQPQGPTIFNSDQELPAGSTHSVKIEWYDGGGGAALRLLWEPTERLFEVSPFQAEIDAASDSDIVIAFIGTGLDHEREGVDKKNLYLPGDQMELVKAVYAANSNLVVVLISGSQYQIPWIHNNVPAILNAWYPGEQGGNAIADVLLGHYNPAGRLPLTYYESLTELPAMDDYEIEHGRTYQYYAGDPLWSFGHGLSYTRFAYTNLNVDYLPDSGTYTLSLNVQNVGQYDGEEVIQFYAAFPGANERYPIKKLVGFQRIEVAKGTQKKVTISVGSELLSFWSDQTRRWELYPGAIEFQVGASSKDIRLRHNNTRK